MARRRRLTAEERALWDRVAAAATPLRAPETPLDHAAAPPPSRHDASAAEPAPPRPPVASRLPGRGPAPAAQFHPAPGPPGPPQVPRMDRGRFDRLRRGRLEPEARIDLHGMTAERAHAALSRFILGAHAAQLRLVLVITGKGREGDAFAHAPHRHGILRHSVPHWLSAPPLVARILEVVPAHNRHGGTGALYVYLRRHRPGGL